MSTASKNITETKIPIKVISLMHNQGAGFMSIKAKFPNLSEELMGDILIYTRANDDMNADYATKNELIKVSRVIKSAVDVLEISHERAYQWFKSDKLHAFNKTPREIILDGKVEKVLNYLDSLEHTIYA